MGMEGFVQCPCNILGVIVHNLYYVKLRPEVTRKGYPVARSAALSDLPGAFQAFD